MFRDAAAEIGTATTAGPVLGTSTVRISDVDLPYLQARLKAAAKTMNRQPYPAPEDEPGITVAQKNEIVAARQTQRHRDFQETIMQIITGANFVVYITTYTNRLFEWLGVSGITRRYRPRSVVSSGTFGAVFKFVAEDSDNDESDDVPPVAVKVTFGLADSIPLPRNIGCDVVRTVAFVGKAVQVMELADRDASRLLPEEFRPFVQWCNKTAMCLYKNNVACPDWKLGNVAVFDDTDQPTFRVIDVDGMFDAYAGVNSASATYTCVATATSNRTDLRRLHQINTAYAIVVSQIIARGGVSSGFKSLLQDMWDRTMDNPRWAVADTLAVLRSPQNMTTLRTTPNYNRIFELLNQLSQPVQLLTDEYIRGVHDNVFKHSSHKWETPYVPAAARKNPKGARGLFSPE